MSQNYEHWSNYWSQGNITSLPFDFQINYDHELATFWNRQFDKLTPGARILDLCTGNGALALLAAEYSNKHGKEFQITAVDAAIINLDAIEKKFPSLKQHLSSIRFISQMQAERFTDSKPFDLICSQYGIEYTEWSIMAGAIDKLTDDNSFIAVVSHAHSSDIITKMKQEKLEYDVLEPVRFYSRTKKLIRNNASRKEMQLYLKAVKEELMKTLLTRQSPILKPLFDACTFVEQAEDEQYRNAKDQLFEFLQGITNGRARLNDLLSIHQKFEQSDDWRAELLPSDFKVNEEGKIMYQQRFNAGDYFIAEKA